MNMLYIELKQDGQKEEMLLGCYVVEGCHNFKTNKHSQDKRSRDANAQIDVWSYNIRQD